MAFFKALFRKFSSAPKQPSRQQVLEAHIVELLELRGERPAGKGPLKVLNTQSEYRVAVEFGLSRLEILATQAGELRAVLPADRFLPGQLSWTPERCSRMQALGARVEPGLAHFVCDFRVPDKAAIRRLVQQLHQAIGEVLEHPESAHYTVAIEPEPRVDNEELLERIKILAKKQDMESRRLVYQCIVNAWFYLPIEQVQERSQVTRAPKVKEWLSQSDALEWVIFSDRESLVEFQGAEMPHMVVSGIRLIQSALAAKVSSLKINPNSKIGGELLATELQTIGDYLASIGVRPLGASPDVAPRA